MATQKLNLTRDQLATFLNNHEQIKQFERLFQIADEVAPSSDTTGISIQAGNAEAAATEALSQIVSLAKDAATNSGAADQKAVQALDALGRIANALEMLATAPVIQNNNSVVTDYVDLNEHAPVPSDKPGRTYWNRDDGTMDVDLYGGSVLQVGQEIHYYAKNTSGGLIANGTPVMFTGTVGSSGKLTFGLAVADGSVPAEYMMGVATQDIADNAFGYVTSFGLVRGFNTTGAPYGEVWADGDLLYFDPATPGTWTNVKPAAPNISVPVAVVVNAGSGGSGSIFVRMELSESLNNLQDVYINGGGPLAGQVMIYDATQQRWENHHLTAGANIAITNGDGSISIAAIGLEPAITPGTTAQYWRGDKTWQDFATSVRAAVLTGLSTATNAVITAADTVLSAFGKLQAQITAHVGASSSVHGVTGNVVGTSDSQTLTNKTISGSNNTLSNIGNASLTNSSVTIGSTTVSLGATAASIAGLTNLGLSGNINFTGTANRVTADFSNATVSNRAMFQTTAANTTTSVASIPSGTGISSSWDAFSSSDPNNASFGRMQIVGGVDFRIVSGLTGTGSYLPITFFTGGSQRVTLNTSGNFFVVNPAGMGYGTGAGGSVTQATNKSTSVTLNKPCGRIIMNNAALAGGASVAFYLLNSIVGEYDVVNVNVWSSANYEAKVVTSYGGTVYIEVKNRTAGSLSDAVTLNFTVTKGADS